MRRDECRFYQKLEHSNAEYWKNDDHKAELYEIAREHALNHLQQLLQARNSDLRTVGLPTLENIQLREIDVLGNVEYNNERDWDREKCQQEAATAMSMFNSDENLFESVSKTIDTLKNDPSQIETVKMFLQMHHWYWHDFCFQCF